MTHCSCSCQFWYEFPIFSDAQYLELFVSILSRFLVKCCQVMSRLLLLAWNLWKILIVLMTNHNNYAFDIKEHKKVNKKLTNLVQLSCLMQTPDLSKGYSCTNLAVWKIVMAQLSHYNTKFCRSTDLIFTLTGFIPICNLIKLFLNIYIYLLI